MSSQKREPRRFEDVPAVRTATPCLIGLVGPSGSGKTYSALRLATGMQRVNGGDIGVIDTEAGRAKHYADAFRFLHMAFTAPFGSLDYLDAIKHYAAKGVKTIVIDSMTHEWTGEGGVLDSHAKELERMGGQPTKTFLAWGVVKPKHRRMVDTMLQLDASIIMCFRAAEKLKLIPGKDPVDRGYQPIASEELIYECLAQFLLLPGSEGKPTWNTGNVEQRALVKKPGQFRELFTEGVQLSEDIGQKLAEWSAGRTLRSAAQIASELATATDAGLAALVAEMKPRWPSFSKDDRATLTAAQAAAKSRLEAGNSTKQPTP